jgi:hypothetical protein
MAHNSYNSGFRTSITENKALVIHQPLSSYARDGTTVSIKIETKDGLLAQLTLLSPL